MQTTARLTKDYFEIGSKVENRDGLTARGCIPYLLNLENIIQWPILGFPSFLIP